MITVNFFEIIPAGSWAPGGWIEEMPEGSGKGIRHYDEVDVRIGNLSAVRVPIVPTNMLIQLQFENSEEDAWCEYKIDKEETISLECKDISVSITFEKRTSDDPDEHKDVYSCSITADE
jgi:hypothetical protein